MLDSCQDSRANLRNAAFVYRDYGWSVVPIRGDRDPENAKAAGVAWSVYQRRLPTYSEIKSWFDKGQFQGLGIVCGRVSGLAVLDFDDPACLDAFGGYCPHLLDTYAVESGSRGLPHLYFEVPASVEIHSQRAAGVDLQFDGTYVIAPPTVINRGSWRVLNDVVPHVLTQADVDLIVRFLQIWGYSQQEKQQIAAHLPVDLEPLYRNTSNGFSRAKVSENVLIHWYRQLARRIGRNNALFRVGCLARDAGWKLQQTLGTLLDVHIAQPPGASHPVETPHQRRREGLQTLRSAFRYSVQLRRIDSTKVVGLPNAIRETLLQFKQAAVARVLDGLRLAGVQAGRVVSERVMCHLLKVFNIGRRTVQSALKSAAPEGDSIFESPPNPPEEPANAAKPLKEQQKTCIFVTGAKRVKNGRPARTYIVPDNQKLYQLYGVRPSGSDPLQPVDLKSPDSYRQALHHKLVERRPGLYSRRWLSARLGISVWTSRRYDRQMGISATYTYLSKRIYWSGIDELPHSQTRPDGTFLETPDGRRYPPLQGLARRLLQAHPFLIYKRQHWNYYDLQQEVDAIPEIQTESPAPRPPTSSQIPARDLIHKHTVAHYLPVELAEYHVCAEPTPEFRLCRDCKRLYRSDIYPVACPKCGCCETEPVAEDIWRDPERCRTWWRGLWQDDQPELQSSDLPVVSAREATLVEKVYATVRRHNPEHALTRDRARQLVREYGETAVERALAVLGERQNVYNAAGFLITVLGGRSAASQPTASGESHADWLEQLKKSPYAAYYEIQ